MRQLLPALALIIWLSPSGNAQNAPAPRTLSAKPTLTDADNFFIEYQRADGLVRQGARAEAAAVIDVLCQRLTSSPWLEIAMLKRCETLTWRNPQDALEGYQLLASRLANAPYYQAESAAFFRAALRATTDRGIGRIRLRRISDALSRYFNRFGKYPEALATLCTYQMLDPADLLDANQRLFRYSIRLARLPRMNYLAYDLERIPSEPLPTAGPRIQSTSKIHENPDRYAALIQTAPRGRPAHIDEGQTLDGYFMIAISARGVILCNHDHVLILPVPR